MGCSDSYSTRLFYAERKPLLLRRRALAALPIFKADLAAVPVIGWERRMEWGSGTGLIFDASACYSPLEDGAGLISSDWLDAFLFR